MTFSVAMESAWLGMILKLVIAFFSGLCLGLIALGSLPDHLTWPANFDPCWGGFVTLSFLAVGKMVARN